MRLKGLGMAAALAAISAMSFGQVISGPTAGTGGPSSPFGVGDPNFGDHLGGARLRISRLLNNMGAGHNLIVAQALGTPGQTSGDMPTGDVNHGEPFNFALSFDGNTSVTLTAGASGASQTRNFATFEDLASFGLQGFSIVFKFDGNTPAGESPPPPFYSGILDNLWLDLDGSLYDLSAAAMDSTQAGFDEFRFVGVTIGGFNAAPSTPWSLTGTVTPFMLAGAPTGEEHFTVDFGFGGAVQLIPEPGTAMLAGLGALVGLLARKRRQD